MINTHNWNKLQLTAEKHLPAVDRRKLLTAFSHSVKRQRERQRKEPCPAHANAWHLPAHTCTKALPQPACMSCMYLSAHKNVQVQTQRLQFNDGSFPCVCRLLACLCVPVVLMQRELPGRHRLLPQSRGSECTCAYVWEASQLLASAKAIDECVALLFLCASLLCVRCV